MELRSHFLVGAAVAALCLGANPARSDHNTYGSDYKPGSGCAIAMDQIASCNITATDIEKVLPMLYSLREADGRRWSTVAYAPYDSSYARSDSPHMTYEAQVDAADLKFNESADKIWNHVSDTIGADKAACLRNLCQVKKETISYEPDEHMKRIDALFIEWDSARARQRVALGLPPEEPRVVATETTVTTSYAHVTPITVTMPATVSIDDLCMLLENKMIADSGMYGDAGMVMTRNGGYREIDMKVYRDRTFHNWD